MYYQRRGLAIPLLLFALSCTSQLISPQLEPPPTVAVLVRAPIVYEGNNEYLPRTISPGLPLASNITFRYSYNEVHRRDDSMEALALFNPLTIVGFPTGGIGSTISARLDLLNGSGVVKSYSAVCELSVTRTIFTDGDSFSDLRRKGLIAVRNNIEAQMYEDQEFLRGLTDKNYREGEKP